ncbi:MAG TPA: glycosyltransferase family 87 protein [Rhizomicrobium sp.]|nr:glycosyltransferase family 87 protein [Rhizomicrobium sp.]
MTTAQTAPSVAKRKRTASPAGPLVLAAISVFGVAFAILVTVMCGLHAWNFDARGYPIVNDFVSYWSAGRLALQGHALWAYDPHLRHAADVATVGHPFADVRGWWYPPLFLFIAAALALLPYAAAFNLMNTVTLLLCGFVTSAIARRREAFFLVAAPPWAMFGIIHGQNQFLTASLIGGIFLTLEQQPMLSGFLLGLLSYKPHLGVLFPIALAFGGYWRAFCWACVSTALLTLLSGIVFGFDTFVPFLHGLTIIGTEATSTVPGYLPTLQSLYGLLRCLNVPENVSWMMQACLSAACIIAVAVLWRSKTAFELKAAGLATLIPLSVPFFQAYDLALLTIALAYLYRHRAFDTRDWVATTCAMLSFGTFWWERSHPATLIACTAVGAIILVRLFGTIRSTSCAGATGGLHLDPKPVLHSGLSLE